jgi:ribA/ribD-fused uncharacterized protein
VEISRKFSHDLNSEREKTKSFDQKKKMNSNERFYENEDMVCFKAGYLSQWHISPFELDGIAFNCCEKRMMYQKAILFNDQETAAQILAKNDPKLHKKLGRQVKNFDEAIWRQAAENIVFEANLAKFSQSFELKEKLLATGNKIIVECSPYDKIWGNGLDITTTLETDISLWPGTNLLGKVLMRVREILRQHS